MQKMNEYCAPRSAALGTMFATKRTTPRGAETLGLILLMSAAAVSVECLAQTGVIGGNRISVLRPDNARTELPLEAGTAKFHNKIGGLGGGKSYVELPGKQAELRLKAGQPQIFLVGIPDNGPGSSYDAIHAQAPSLQWAMLYKLDLNKKNREVPLVDSTGFGPISKTKAQDFRGIPLNFSRYDDHTVRIEPRSLLPAGEYAFLATSVTQTDAYGPQNQLYYYCFGID
jgi:hypothetical protein